jgi:hypothetical protein
MIPGAGWLSEEMALAEFGDARLSKRLGNIVDALVVAPDASFPVVFNDASLAGAYRFFNNHEVTPERILAPHARATVERMSAEEVSLVVHDTSTMSFDPHGARRGLGRVRSAGQAFFAHVSLALSGDGTRMPLGVLAMAAHIRGKKKRRKKGKGKTKSTLMEVGARERWWNQVSSVSSLGLDRTRTVHVQDREADDYVFYVRLVEGGHRFVTRLMHDRLLEPALSGGARKLSDAFAQIAVRAEREVALSRRPVGDRSPIQLATHPAREGRMAKLAMSATKVVLRRPSPQPKTLPEHVAVNVVRVWELDAPAGQDSVEWLLVTTEPVDTAEQILNVVDWYRARWVIEEFFKALKTGCSYGKRQLETLEGLLNVLATFLPIAWRMLQMRTLARGAPNVPATMVLPDPMLAVLKAFTRIEIPSDPTARDALLAVAALGGHLKHNGEPGWLTLARGYEKLVALTDGWLAARGLPHCADV